MIHRPGSFKVVVRRGVAGGVLLVLVLALDVALGHDVVQLLFGVQDVLLDLVRDKVEKFRVFVDERREDGRELVVLRLEVQETLDERRGGDLHAAFVGGIDLEVVAVGTVQAEESVAVWIAAGVHPHSKVAAEKFRLVLPEVGQDAAKLEDEKRLRDAFGGTLLTILHGLALILRDGLPRERFELRLAVDAAEVPALLQDAHHLLPLLNLFFPLLLAAEGGPGLRERGRAASVGFDERLFAALRVDAVRKEGPALLQAVRIQPAADVEELLQPRRGLQLGLLPRPVPRALLQQLQQRPVFHAHLHLLLGSAVAVPDHREHRAKFLLWRLRGGFPFLLLLPRGFLTLVLHRLVFGVVLGGRLVRSLGGLHRRRVLRGDRLQDDRAKAHARVVKVLCRIFHKRPPVDVAHVRPALGPQQVEPTHGLPERKAHPPRDLFFIRGQQHGEALLLPVLVSLDPAVDDWGLSRLCVRVVGTDGVHLDVGATRAHEVLVYERGIPAHGGVRLAAVRRGRGIVPTGLVAHLAEQRFVPAADGVRVVDADVVVLGIRGFLHEGLVDALAVELDVVLVFLEPRGFETSGPVRHGARVDVVVAVDHDVIRDRYVILGEGAVDHASVEEVPLLLQVVHHEGFAQLGVLLDLGEGEPVGEERDQRVHLRPLLDGLLQDAVVAEGYNLKLGEVPEAVEDLEHRLGLGLLVHGAHPNRHLAIPQRHLGGLLRSKTHWQPARGAPNTALIYSFCLTFSDAVLAALVGKFSKAHHRPLGGGSGDSSADSSIDPENVPFKLFPNFDFHGRQLGRADGRDDRAAHSERRHARYRRRQTVFATVRSYKAPADTHRPSRRRYTPRGIQPRRWLLPSQPRKHLPTRTLPTSRAPPWD